jgi:hypothetical protein
MRYRKSLAAAALLVLAATPSLASWRDDVSRYDEGRLTRLDESRARGLREAARGASARDLAVLHGVLDPRSRPISEHALLGTWQCRSMKLGGLAPDIVYSWFRCRVRQTGSGLYFEKISGTEKMSGYLDTYDRGRFLFMGALTVKAERPKPYSGGNEGVGAPTSSGDVVGIVSGIGPNRARIEFPYPTIESTFDVIEHKR